MSVDLLSDALNTIKTHELKGEKECTVPASKVIRAILSILKENGYILDFEDTEERGIPVLKVSLAGRINNCGVIKPRFPVKKDEWAKTEQKYIPGFGVGLLLVSTPYGIMTNREAEKKETGGRLLAYVY